MPPSLQTLAHENLSSSVYAALCDALMKGHFQPGDRLKIRELAEQFGTSVTPVRDAIIRLTHDEALVFQSVAENMASEQSARMVAMKAATDNAGSVIDELKLIYNKTRQAAITKELSEIVAGAAAV